MEPSQNRSHCAQYPPLRCARCALGAAKLWRENLAPCATVLISQCGFPTGGGFHSVKLAMVAIAAPLIVLWLMYCSSPKPPNQVDKQRAVSSIAVAALRCAYSMRTSRRAKANKVAVCSAMLSIIALMPNSVSPKPKYAAGIAHLCLCTLRRHCLPNREIELHKSAGSHRNLAR